MGKAGLGRVWSWVVIAAVVASCGAGARAQEAAYGAALQGFQYAWPAQRYGFVSQRQGLAMAYLDVRPQGAGNGQVAVLLHGKNFCAGTWEGTIRALVAAGWRVVAPDQVGFCMSDKPGAYQFSFGQLAANTRGLLRSLGIERAVLVGHSTGGMLAIRYALMFPGEVERLVLVDPIGLEDWQAKGVPSIGVDAWYARELRVGAEGIRAYERETYYAGEWRPEYERWVGMLAGLNAGPGKADVAWDSALIYDMIMTQPVVHELGQLRVPTLLMVGDKDTTAIGKDLAPPEVRAGLGHYRELADAAGAAIPGSTVVHFPELGHAPQISDPARVHGVMLEWLGR